MHSLNTCYTGTVEIIGEYILEQSVSVRAVPELIVCVCWGGGGGGGAGATVQFFGFVLVPVLHNVKMYVY